MMYLWQNIQENNTLDWGRGGGGKPVAKLTGNQHFGGGGGGGRGLTCGKIYRYTTLCERGGVVPVAKYTGK